MPDRTRGIHELYRSDPVEADELLWGRKSDRITRRGFLNKSGLLAMSAAVGASIPFAHLMPGGLIPAALAQSDEPFSIPGKEGLIILNDRPLNAETPAHLLDDRITPAKHLFVRNNGVPPVQSQIDPETWSLEIGGESVTRNMSFSIAELKQEFEHFTYQLQLECGGNGRSEFVPAASSISGQLAPLAVRNGPAFDCGMCWSMSVLRKMLFTWHFTAPIDMPVAIPKKCLFLVVPQWLRHWKMRP